MKKITKFLYIIFIFLLLNFFSFVFIYYKTNFNMYSSEFKDFKKRFSKSEKKTVYPHPFFGYAFKGHSNFKNSLGNNHEPIFLRIPNNVNDKNIKILILGGSVAANLSSNGSEDKFIVDELEFYKNDIFEKTINQKFNTSRFKVFNAAIPGGKQPQQLFKLNYIILNDLKFDIIINLDGFNELALSYAENLPIQNNVIYPRQYSRQLKAFSADIKCTIKSNISIKNTSLIPILELYNLYKIYNCHKKIYGIENSQIDENFSKLSNFINESNDEKLKKIIKLWENSSQMIENLSIFYDIDYIHVLQPNQYLKNSKILTNYEKNISNYEKYKNPIEKFYNIFNLNNIELKYKFDARNIFDSNKDSLYRDYCCHLNNKGMYILSLKIINEFNDLFESKI